MSTSLKPCVKKTGDYLIDSEIVTKIADSGKGYSIDFAKKLQVFKSSGRWRPCHQIERNLTCLEEKLPTF